MTKQERLANVSGYLRKLSTPALGTEMQSVLLSQGGVDGIKVNSGNCVNAGMDCVNSFNLKSCQNAELMCHGTSNGGDCGLYEKPVVNLTDCTC